MASALNFNLNYFTNAIVDPIGDIVNIPSRKAQSLNTPRPQNKFHKSHFNCVVVVVSSNPGMLREVEEGKGGVCLSCLIKWVDRLLVAHGAWFLADSWFRAFVPNG